MGETDGQDSSDFSLRTACEALSCQHSKEWLQAVRAATGGRMLDSVLGDGYREQKEKDGKRRYLIGSGENEKEELLTPEKAKELGNSVPVTEKVEGDFDPLAATGLTRTVNIDGETLQVSPQDSLIMSALTLCPTGVIYNLDKYRQVKCQRLLCYEDVASNGGNVALCETQHAQAMCMSVMGEAYTIVESTIGLVAFWDAFISQVTNIVSNIFRAMIGELADQVLGNFCHPQNRVDLERWQSVLVCDLPMWIGNMRDFYHEQKAVIERPPWQRINIDFSGSVDDVCADVRALNEEEEDGSTTTTMRDDS